MENIYSRNALWRIILEADLKEVVSKRDEKNLNDLKQHAEQRQRSKSFTSSIDRNDDEVFEDPRDWQQKRKDLRDLQSELKSFSKDGLSPSAVKGHIRSKSVTDIEDTSRDSYLYNGLPPRHSKKNRRKKDPSRSKSNPNIAMMDTSSFYNSAPMNDNDIIRQKNAINAQILNSVPPNHYNTPPNQYNTPKARPKSMPYANNNPRPKSLSYLDSNNNPSFPNYVNFNQINGMLHAHPSVTEQSLSSSSANSSRSYGSAVFSGVPVEPGTSSRASESTIGSHYSSLGYSSDMGHYSAREDRNTLLQKALSASRSDRHALLHQLQGAPAPPPRRSFPPPNHTNNNNPGQNSMSNGRSHTNHIHNNRHSYDSVFNNNPSVRSPPYGAMNGMSHAQSHNNNMWVGLYPSSRGSNFLTRNPRSKMLTSNTSTSLPRKYMKKRCPA